MAGDRYTPSALVLRVGPGPALPRGARPAEALFRRLVARDPQQAAEIILAHLMDLSDARTGALFAVAPRLRLLVGQGIDQQALDWTAQTWRQSAAALREGRLSRCDERFLVPVRRSGRLTALVYMSAAELDLDGIAQVADLIGDAAPRCARQPRQSSPVDAYLAEAPTEEIERRRLVLLLERHEGNVARVARELRVARTTVYKRMAAMGIPRQRLLRRLEYGRAAGRRQP